MSYTNSYRIVDTLTNMYSANSYLISEISDQTWNPTMPVYKLDRYIPLSLFRFRYAGLSNSILAVIKNTGIDYENSILAKLDAQNYNPIINSALQLYYGRLSTKNRMKFNTEFYECMNEVVLDTLPKSMHFTFPNTTPARTVMCNYLTAPFDYISSQIYYEESTSTKIVKGDSHALFIGKGLEFKCHVMMTIKAEYVTQFMELYSSCTWNYNCKPKMRMLPNPKWFKLFVNTNNLESGSTPYRAINYIIDNCDITGIATAGIDDGNLASIFDISMPPIPLIHEFIGGNLTTREEHTTKFIRELFSSTNK